MPNVRGNPSEGLVSPWQADPKPKAEGKAKAKVKKEDGKSFSRHVFAGWDGRRKVGGN